QQDLHRHAVAFAAAPVGLHVERPDAGRVGRGADHQTGDPDRDREPQPPRHLPTAFRIASPKFRSPAAPCGSGSSSSHNSDTEAEPTPTTRCRPPIRTTTSRSRGPSASERTTEQSRLSSTAIPGRIRRISQTAPHSSTTIRPIVSDRELSESASYTGQTPHSTTSCWK